jgi:hypothetical protein
VRDGSGELSGLGETGSEKTGNLLDQGIGGDEGIVLASKLLDELLVLVKLLQVLQKSQYRFSRRVSEHTHVSAHGIDTVVLGTIDIVLVTEDAKSHACALLLAIALSSFAAEYRLTGPGDGGQLDGSAETLVTLRVIVLETDLELNGLDEVALLGLGGVLKELLDVRTDAGNRDFRHFGWCLPRD